MSTPNPVTSQPGRFRRLFTAPVYQDNEDKTQRARLLNAILWIEFATMLFAAPFLLISSNVLSGLIPIVGFLVLSGTGLLLLRRGFIEFTSILLVVGLYLAETLLVLISGGIHSPLTAGYIVVMSVAGFLLSRRQFFALSGLSLVSLFGIALLQTSGVAFPLLIDFGTPLQAAAAVTGNVFTAVLLFYLAFSGMSEALARARQSNQELMVFQASLEQRINARTEQLRTSADVGRAAVSILDTAQLLRETVNLITERFNFYYTAVFLADDTNQWAVLREATGEAGRALKERQHRLEIGGQSMVGTAMKTHKARVALDVGAEAVRFVNPLLPDTRSEIALPLMIGSRVLGALDVQSTEAAAFDEASAAALQTMADQIAIALSNTLQFQQTQAALQRTQQLYEASTAIANAADADSILRELIAQVASDAALARILTYGPRDETGQYAYLEVAASWSSDSNALRLPGGTRVSLAQAGPLIPQTAEPVIIRDATDSSVPPDQQALMQALGMRAMLVYALVAGSQPHGMVQIAYREPHMFTPVETQSLLALIGQVAVTLRNLQLVREQQLATQQLDEINQRLTRQAWQQYTREHGQAVQKVDVGPGIQVTQAIASKLAAPVVVHGQQVGQLRVEDATPDREWTPTEKALVQAVAGEVAIAIENARLIEQTERRAQRETLLNQIAQRLRRTTDIQTILQTATEQLSLALDTSHAQARLGGVPAVAQPPNGQHAEAEEDQP